MFRIFLTLLAFLFLTGCLPNAQVPQSGARILMIGDSALAWNRNRGTSVGDALARELGEPVINRSVTGAKISAVALSGFDIRAQYSPGPWTWIVMNGGANDLAFECGCSACAANLNGMISADGTRGDIPDFVRSVRQTGAKVVWMGYIQPPTIGNLMAGCRANVLDLQARVARMAARDTGITFVRMKDAFPNNDYSFYDGDLIHPSPLGSATLAKRLAGVMRRAQ